MPPSIHACLSVWGSFDPADLTRLFGVGAKTRRAGDARPGGRIEDDDLWHYSTTEEDSWEWPEHLERVLALVRPHRDEFVRYCDERGLEREVHLVAQMPGETPIGTVSTAHLAELASLRCALDIDLYCLPPFHGDD